MLSRGVVLIVSSTAGATRAIECHGQRGCPSSLPRHRSALRRWVLDYSDRPSSYVRLLLGGPKTATICKRYIEPSVIRGCLSRVIATRSPRPQATRRVGPAETPCRQGQATELPTPRCRNEWRHPPRHREGGRFDRRHLRRL